MVVQEDVWTKIDKQFVKTMEYAEKAYRTNYFINLFIVAIGVIFLGSSLFFAYTRGLDASTLTFAGLGIADFVALFLVNPQSRIQQLIGDLSQIMVIYRTWKVQMSLAEQHAWDASGNPQFQKLDEIANFNTELTRIAEASLSAIENYVGREPAKKSSQQSTQNSKH